MDNEPEAPAYLTASKIITYAMYIWVWFGIIVLALRVFLLAFSANSAAPFVDFVYRTSSGFLQPFRGIFPPQSVSMTGYVDIAALFAIIIYGLIGWGFAALLHFLQSKINAYRGAAKADASQTQQTVNQPSHSVGSQKTTGRATPPRKPPRIQ